MILGGFCTCGDKKNTTRPELQYLGWYMQG